MKHKAEQFEWDFLHSKSFGTDPHKLARSEGPDTSKAAAESVDTTSLESMVFSAIENFGRRGAIADDILKMFPGFPYSSITARFSALIRKGFVSDTGERRPGRSGRSQRVMIAL
jgi:hypothetical protein